MKTTWFSVFVTPVIIILAVVLVFSVPVALSIVSLTFVGCIVVFVSDMRIDMGIMMVILGTMRWIN